MATLLAACGSPGGMSTTTATQARVSTRAEAQEGSNEGGPDASADPRSLRRCFWEADGEAPPAEGPGSLAELDDAVRASRSATTAIVVGRLRLRAHGCPRISAALALVPHPDDFEEKPAANWVDPAELPTPGPPGEERRDAVWTADEWREVDTDCNVSATLLFVRAMHTPTGAIARLDFEVLDEDVCTLHGHRLQHGDFDDDGATEIRVDARIAGMDDMSGADWRGRLWIFDLESFRPQVALTLSREDQSVLNRADRSIRRSEMEFSDLDGDGHRDIVLRVREEATMSTGPDLLTYRERFNEAYRYDAQADVYRRAGALDDRIPRGSER